MVAEMLCVRWYSLRGKHGNSGWSSFAREREPASANK